jgi:hypothetical protein
MMRNPPATRPNVEVQAQYVLVCDRPHKSTVATYVGVLLGAVEDQNTMEGVLSVYGSCIEHGG